MLYLIGIGLDKNDIPLSSIEAAKACTLVCLDRYTTFVDEDRIAFLKKLLGKQLQELSRSDMEEDLPELLEKAKKYNVAILVGGDPLVATTHKIMFIEAKKLGVQVKVVHANSALSVLMGESGLDFYRFGQICTISKWVQHYSPVSFYETIQRNHTNELHSLVLMDYVPEHNSSLEIKEAVRIMEEAEQKYAGKLFDDKTTIFVMHKMGLPDQQKTITTLKQAKMLSFANGPTAIIVPAKLSDVEKEVIGSMY